MQGRNILVICVTEMHWRNLTLQYFNLLHGFLLLRQLLRFVRFGSPERNDIAYQPVDIATYAYGEPTTAFGKAIHSRPTHT